MFRQLLVLFRRFGDFLHSLDLLHLLFDLQNVIFVDLFKLVEFLKSQLFSHIKHYPFEFLNLLKNSELSLQILQTKLTVFEDQSLIWKSHCLNLLFVFNQIKLLPVWIDLFNELTTIEVAPRRISDFLTSTALKPQCALESIQVLVFLEKNTSIRQLVH